MKLDSITLPHLQCLKSLDLTCVVLSPRLRGDLGKGHSHDSQKSKQAALDDQVAVSSTTGAIWDALGNSGIHLDDVSITQINASFLTYIESYSGLRKIFLSTSGMDNRVESDQLAARFWSKSLAKHVQTLEVLNVKADRENTWCLGDQSLSSIKKCGSLRSLTIFMSAETGNVEADSENIVVSSILFPNLQKPPFI